MTSRLIGLRHVKDRGKGLSGTKERDEIMRSLSLIFAATFFFHASAAASSKPNVIILLVDDAGYGDHSCLGNPVLKTPNIDRLHSQSIRFTDFHVAPMCTPTRGQLMTGCDALRNGAMNVSSGRAMLRQNFATMPQIFAANGYRTAMFGKWHLGDNYPYRPQDRGFQQAAWFPSSHIPSAPDYFKNDYFNTWLRRENGKTEQYTGYCTDIYFDLGMKWIAERKQANEPFFLYLPTNAPHGPLYVPQKYRDLYNGQAKNVASFFGMIANIDENVGKLEVFLADQKLRDNTIFIYMTDNGGTGGVSVYNAGMRGKKIDLWEGGHRVPCFVRWPGGDLGQPRDIGELTEVQDILPMLIDLCALDQKGQSKFDGTSLAGLLRGTQKELPDRMLVSQFSRMNAPQPAKGDAAVMWKKWRLVSDKELYDIAADPGQKTNVIEQHADIAAKMRAHYDKWWAEVSPRVNEFSAITVGDDHENPTMLSPADWADSFLDQSAQIRAGLQRNGPWHVEVAKAGEYEISLRRWPVEADLSLRAAVPSWKGGDGVFTPGIALPIAKAKLKVGVQEQSLDTKEPDKAATFTLKLPAGGTQIQTWFYDEQGKELCGAYYVYVRRK
jgi:arylsulfatase